MKILIGHTDINGKNDYMLSVLRIHYNIPLKSKGEQSTVTMNTTIHLNNSAYMTVYFSLCHPPEGKAVISI